MKEKYSLKEICITSIFTAITAVLSQIAIPIPFSPIPFAPQIFAIYLSGIILGKKLGCLSQMIYVVLGGMGLPVFSNFSGGMQSILGPTGGFIISFPIIAYIIGYVSENNKSIWMKSVILSFALFVSYSMGIIQLSIVTKMSIQKSTFLMLPYIPLDIVKIILAYGIGTKVKKRLMKAGFEI
ncbi:biotin transporter BioY [Inediibacterium massiliense]|uniref:biotin transporter BioY n=1 Tax=Inediibacterium massiliense TaxID=1658111 RepID=UPI0006B57111|nr:biotin transporter BioY [Inediibacterium massiliense]